MPQIPSHHDTQHVATPSTLRHPACRDSAEIPSNSTARPPHPLCRDTCAWHRNSHHVVTPVVLQYPGQRYPRHHNTRYVMTSTVSRYPPVALPHRLTTASRAPLRHDSRHITIPAHSTTIPTVSQYPATAPRYPPCRDTCPQHCHTHRVMLHPMSRHPPCCDTHHVATPAPTMPITLRHPPTPTTVVTCPPPIAIYCDISRYIPRYRDSPAQGRVLTPQATFMGGGSRRCPLLPGESGAVRGHRLPHGRPITPELPHGP